MKSPKPLKPLVVKGKALETPEFDAYCLVKTDQLQWSVLTLRVKQKKVVHVSMTDGDIQPVTIQTLIKKILRGIKMDEMERKPV